MKIKLLAKNFLFFLLTLFVTTSNGLIAQDLTISTGATSNISSSTSGGVVTYSLTNTAANGVLNVSDIQTQLNAGNDVTIEARNITINASITATSNNANLTFKAANYIVQNNTTITTNGGDVTFWADSDNSSAGYAELNNASIVTNGGDITIGGGSDPTANPAIGPPGVNIHTGSSLDAGSGAISIRGNSNGLNDYAIGVRVHTATISSGNATFFGEGSTLAPGHNWGVSFEASTFTASGNVTITGTAGGTTGIYNHGVYIATTPLNITGSTTITGTGGPSSGIINFGVYLNGSSINGLGSGAMNITGIGGGTGSSSDNDGIHIGNTSTVQSGSGTMTLTGTMGTGIYSEGIVFYNGTNTLGHVSNQTGDIILKSDNTVFNGATNLNTTGAVSLLPLDASSSFGVAQTIGSNMVLSSGVSGLTIGKSGNTASVTLTAAQTVAGPISVYGNAVRVEQNLTSTGTNTPIRIVSQGVGTSGLTEGFISLSSSKNITTSGGDIILWSNAQNITSGQANNEILLGGSNTLSTSGGKIVLAGGLDDGSNGGTVSDGIPDGYAYRGSYTGEAINIVSNVTLNSAGGEIIIRGEQNGSDAAVGADATFTISNGGAVTIEGKNTTATSVVLGTANIASTATNAPVTISGTTHITNSGLTTITTQGGDVLLASNVDDATDGESDINGYIRLGSGLSVTTNGGDITIGGGEATGSGYAIGRTDDDSFTEGVRVDATLVLNSGGGDIGIRGKTSTKNNGVSGAGNAGFGVYSLTSAGEINSGTGTITIEGINQNPNQTNYSSGIIFALNGGHVVTISSANTTANAISISASATGPNAENFGMEVETNSPLIIAATGSGGGVNLTLAQSATTANKYDFVVRSPLDILANGGPITLSGSAGGIWYVGSSIDTYLGRRASSLVETSSSAITVEFDRYNFNSGRPYVGTSGAVTVRPASTSFGSAFSTDWFLWNQNPFNMTGLTIGKVGNTTNVSHDTQDVTVAGPIEMYGGTISVNANLTTTSGSGGDISLYTDNNLGGLSSVRTITADGAFKLIPNSTSFSSNIIFPITNLDVDDSNGLTIGKSGNTADITMAQAQNIAGPITLYGGTLTLNADLTTTNSGDISLYTDNALGGLSATRNLTAAGSFKYIPSGSSFAQDVTYPINNLNVSSNGLTIGKSGNTGNITLSTDLNINAIALFGGTLALNHNIDCSSLELSGTASGTATLAKGKYINASGNMTNNATLILSSDSDEFSRLMVGGTVSGSGTFKYQRWVAGSTTNDLISSPFPGETFGSLVTNNSGVLRTNPSNSNQHLFGPFDNDNGVYQTYFSTTNASTILTAGEGYRAGTENGSTLEFTGTYLTSNQTTPINLGSHNTYGKWNLVGNPFPTYLDLNGFIDDNDNTAILDPLNTAVYAYDGDDTDGSNWDIYNLANSTGIKIAPGQAFFVASSSGGGNLTFNTSRQTITGGDDFLPNLWQTPDAHAVINLKNTDQVSSTDLYINSNGSLGLDPGYDAGTYANESSDFSLYTKLADGSYPDTKFAIQTIADDLSQTVVIPLGVHINAGTGYSIALDDNTLLELVRVYLKDNATGAFTLLNDGAYFFETDVDLEGALRFELHLSDQVTLGTPDEYLTSFKTVYHNDEVLLVGVFELEDTIEIYDLMGRLIQEYRPEQNGFGTLVISDQSKASGIYIVRINREGTHQSLKFLID